MWKAEASRDGGKRFIVQAEELATAFLELEMQCKTDGTASIP